MRFAAVFFDSGGTIFDFDGKAEEGPDPSPDALSEGACGRVATALGWLGYQVDSAALREKLDRLQESRIWAQRRPANEESLIAGLLEEIGLPAKPEEVLYLTGVYSGPRYRSWVFPEVHQVLARLKAAGLAMGLIANTNCPGWIMDRNFRGAGLLEFLDPRVYSGDEGISKPDPRIFHLAAERAGVAGRPILYVGNSVSADIEGGRRAGWSTALLRSSESTSKGLADFEIDAWSELPDIVLP